MLFASSNEFQTGNRGTYRTLVVMMPTREVDFVGVSVLVKDEHLLKLVPRCRGCGTGGPHTCSGLLLIHCVHISDTVMNPTPKLFLVILCCIVHVFIWSVLLGQEI